MLESRQSFPESELDRSRSGMLVRNPKYTSPIASSGVRHIFPRLTEVVVYSLERQEKRGSMYTRERLGKVE